MSELLARRCDQKNSAAARRCRGATGAASARGAKGFALSDVISLEPFLRIRKAKECAHAHVEVDMTAAELTCDDCKAKIDPWWYIRHLATSASHQLDMLEQAETRVRALDEQIRQRVEQANKQLHEMNAEIARLRAQRDMLATKPVARRRRKQA